MFHGTPARGLPEYFGMAKLKTLDEHNREKVEAYEAELRGCVDARKNGIACPRCGSELLDTHPSLTLMSYPPKKRVGCPSEGCTFTGYRIA